MDISMYKQAITKIIGLQTGELNGETVVKDGELWRILTAEEIILVDSEYKELVSKSLVPQSITMRQARLALLAHNKLGDIQATIDNLPSPMKEQTQIEWEYASDVEITNPLIVQLMSALGFTENDIDNLFIEASKL